MGTPEFAVQSLKALTESAEVLCVVTQTDKPKGRGHKLQPPPVKVFAEKNNIPVLQPARLKSPEVIEQLAAFNADLIVVVAYGKILPQAILDLPKFGCINVHASLLPKYRGAAPIEWSIINGETLTGVTTMKMDAGLDTGDMLLSTKIEIGEDMILPELKEILSVEGAKLLIETINNLDAIKPVKQDDALSNYAPMLTKDTGKIDWTKSAREIHNLVRGLYGGAFTNIDEQKFKIWRTKIFDTDLKLSAGEIKIDGKKFFVGTGDSTLEILELQAPNSKKLDAASYLLGHKLEDKKFSE
ncbi:MAG: methionyl-tRNA formyltransferase [Selenomonadaceae bacterium]|nr:methionyl-tRNA formyltransferase [Selenomonadaceae bacterium]